MRTHAPHSRLRVLLLALTLLALVPTAANAAPKKVFLRLSASNYTVVESGGQVTITALRSGNVRAAVSVDYITQDGTAAAPGDYTASTGTLNFAANETRQTFTIPVVNNATVGPASKKFTVKLQNLTSASPTQFKAPSTATVTILDDDGPGSIDFSSAQYSVVEGAGVATITVTRAANPALVESVDYTTSDGSAVAGSDYTTTAGTLTFNAGETSKTFQVPIIDDNVFENDEALNVTLSNPQNVSNPLQPPVLGPTAAAAPATLDIADDDTATFSFDQPTYTVAEDIAAPHLKTITVTRGGDLDASADIGYSVDPTAPGTATGSGTDYTLAAGTLHFAPGETSKTFDVTIIDDGLVEGNETIGLLLTKDSTRLATALLSIVDNDTTNPSVQFSNVGYNVDESQASVDLTVTLSKPAAGGETVRYTTADAGSTNPATGATLPATADGNADYQKYTNQLLTFAAGETTKTVTIPLNPDSVVEGDETFTVTLSGQTGLQLGDPHVATVTILDDDSSGSLEFSSVRYDVNETAGHATITVNRVGGSSGSASVDYATSDGTAHAPADYTSTHGTLTFGDGETQKTFEVPVSWDGRQEGDETVSLQLSNFDSDDDPGDLKAAVLHIADDGASGPVQFSAAAYTVSEKAGSATITVNRSGGSLGGPVTVDYAGSDGTHGTLTFGAGETSKTFQVPVVDDNVHTGTRTVNLTLSNPGGGTSLGGQATAALSITDDEPASSPSTDKAAPKLTITAKKLQKALSGHKIVFKVRSNEAAGLKIAVKLRKGTRKVVVVTRASKKVAAGKTVMITLKLNQKALRALRKALVHGKVKVTLSVKGTDAAKNSATVNKTITLK